MSARREGDSGASPGLALWGRPLLSLTWAGGVGATGPRWPRLDGDPSSGPRGSPSSPPGAGGVGASGPPGSRPDGRSAPRQPGSRSPREWRFWTS